MKILTRMTPLLWGIALAGVLGSAPRPAAADPPAGRGYNLVFSDEFNGTALDTAAWSSGYPWGTVHNGRANMLPSQISVKDGLLTLTARAGRTYFDRDGYWDNGLGKYITFDYTSGTINTYGKRTWRYGYFEGRFRMPWQVSTWPAFWGLQDGWPPEIDIFEVQGDRRRAYVNYHYTNNGQHASFGTQYWTPDGAPNLAQGWHTYAVEWTPTALTFYIDGAKLQGWTAPDAIAQMKWMYLIIDLQVGGWAPDPSAAEYPAQLQCDWVRVWQVPEAANGIYRLTPNAAPQRALNVRDNGTANGTAIDVHTAAFTLNQRWQIEKQADGSFKIKAWPGRTDVNQVMDLNAWATSNGAAVTTWQDVGSQNQRWYFEALDDGWWRITPAIATDKCLEVYGTAASEGSPVDIWGFWGGANQVWRLDPPDTPIPGDANADGTVTLNDARLILRAAGGLSVLPGLPSVRAADVAPKPSAAYRGYGDGSLDTMDAVRVLRYLAGLETSWP